MNWSACHSSFRRKRVLSSPAKAFALAIICLAMLGLSLYCLLQPQP